MANPKRVCLTKSELNSPAGAALVKFIQTIADDGEISIDEVRALHLCLNSPEFQGLPAVPFLQEILSAVLEDNQLSYGEGWEIKNALMRVVPKSIRSELAFEVETAREPATQRQLDYLRALGATPAPNLSKTEASEMIDSLVSRRAVSQRQMMVLRFWDRLDMANARREEVSQWMDEWYGEDERRWMAWEMFKGEHRDDGAQRDPSWVPIGAGREYLKRLHRYQSSPPPISISNENFRFPPPEPQRSVFRTVVLLLVFLVIVLAVMFS